MATGDEHIEEAAGTVNGLNRNFSISLTYESGTLYVLGNGQLWPQDDDESADEVDPGAGTFRLRVPPASDDRVLVRYIEG